VTATATAGGVLGPARRVRRITGAFMWLGVTESVAYPLMLALNNVIGPSAVPILYHFVARLVPGGPDVGFDYYTFVIIGFVTTTALNGGLTAFSGAIDSAIQQGRFETFLVQPVSWYTLPFALAAWPIVLALLNATVMATIALALGASIELARLPLALLVLALGVAASHAIGTLAASVRLLSKKADPVVTLYNLGALVFSGALFPVSMLPGFIRPVAYLLPHTYVISGIRRTLMPHGDAVTGPSLGLSLAVLALSTIVLYTCCLYAFGRALEFGRRYGILGGY
jgi:ABC-2 type transport system permease protein